MHELVERIVELEMRVAFQDDTMQRLNAVITDQNLRIEQLERRLELMLTDLKSLRGLLYADPAQEPPPPHY
ncbi:SlyX family protein [Aquimonas voraii]|uniref:Protein SlyX homolog n=1 Tax=Aquimonas voraii TaxID=265719 RepID=A0A1G6XS03_9GAMM|nr:SlyX family protein [Aquimonas voraii]SDD80984.1 SlyX protein [Aquimonas voraii]